MSQSTPSLIAQYELQFDERPSNLDRFLSQHGPLNRLQIQTLILWQQSRSWRNGPGTRTEEYLQRYPQLFTDREMVLDLIYSEYLLSRKLDPTIVLDQFSRRFPDYAEQLRQQLVFREGVGAELIDDWLAEDENYRGQEFDDSHSTSIAEVLYAGDGLKSGSKVKRMPRLSLPGYRIISELGRGGLAVVYLAEDERLHRPVALKMLLAGKLASDVLLRRMEVEGEAIARLQHPNIVQIFEVGRYEEHPFLALEYANSGTLAQWMGRQPQAPRLAATIVGQLAKTVQYAHDKGILHRDLKPSNVLLHDLNSSGEIDRTSQHTSGTLDDISHLRLKIADFGLAKFINDDSHESPLPAEAATRTGDLLGTAAYMSPEQAKGSANHLSAATDIYSLGTILYELLTGRPPFVGVEPIEMLNQVLFDEPVRPSELVPHIPRDLETICLKCLYKNPERRYATADELADEIDRYLSNQPIRARRSSVFERSWRWCRRHPAQASSVVFVTMFCLLLIGGLVAYSEIMRERLETISIANGRERTLRNEALDRLFQSHLSRANALLSSQKVGQRFASLEALDEAYRLGASIVLDDAQRQRIRNGVLAALSLSDIQFHSDRVIAFNPMIKALALDGRQRIIALPTSETQVTLFDVETTTAWLTVDAQQSIKSLALNRDATLLAVGGKKLRIFDLTSDPPTCVLEGKPTVCTFSTTNSRELLTVDKNACVDRLNVDSAESTVLFRSSGKPRQVAMAPDGQSVAIWTDGRVEVFDATSGQICLRLPPPVALDESALVWNAASNMLAVGPYQHGIELWDVRDRTKSFTVPQNELSTKFCFDSIGSRLLIYSQWGSYVKLWNLTTGQCEFTQKNMRLQAAMASPSGFRLWENQADSKLVVASIVTPALFKELPSISRASAMASSVFVAYSHDGSMIAILKYGTLELFDASSLKLLGKVIMGGGYFRFDPSDNLMTLDSMGMYRWPKHMTNNSTDSLVRDVQFGPPEKLFDAPPFAPFEISRDGNWVAVSTSSDALLWSKLPGQQRINLPHEDVRRLSISPDNKLCATGGWNSGNVNIWRIANGERIKLIEEPTPCIVRFSNDGKWLAVGSKDIAVWNTRDWTIAWRHDVTGFASSGTNLCFSPDSQQLAVSDATGKIRLLEVDDGGRQYAEIISPIQDQILEMTFSPDGRQLALLTFRGACIWDLKSLGDELTSRDLDWDRRIQKHFTWRDELPKHVSVPSTSIVFNLDEQFRQREASEQAVRVDEALAQHDYLSAKAAIDRAIELGLSDPMACNDLAWKLVTGPLEFRDTTHALELIHRAIDSPKAAPTGRALFLNTQGVVQYRAGLLDKAFDTLTESLASQSPNDQPYDLYFLSMTAARRGEGAAAKEYFDKAETLRIQFNSSSSLERSRELEEFAKEAREFVE